MVSETVERFGRLDILVTMRHVDPQAAEDLAVEEWTGCSTPI